MWITSLTLKGATLNLRLSIYNPNPFELNVQSLTYRTTKVSDGVEIAEGELREGIAVAAESSGIANVIVQISFGGLGAASKSVVRRGKTD